MIAAQVGRETNGHKGGRPPRTAVMILQVLKERPELEHQPREIAKIIALRNGKVLTVNAVRQSLTRLRGKNGGSVVGFISHVCDECLAPLSSTEYCETVCSKCGKSYGFAAPVMEFKQGVKLYDDDHHSVENHLHRAYLPNGQYDPRGSMISGAALHIAEFGDGVEGRLTRRALSAAAQLCKGSCLPYEVTSYLAILIEKGCSVRAQYIREVSREEVKNAVISALLACVKDYPQWRDEFLRMVRETTVAFPDGMPKPSKMPKPSILSENFDLKGGLTALDDEALLQDSEQE